MVIGMKTTMNLPDALLEAVKQRASAERRTQTSVVEEAIRRMLSEEPPPRPGRAMPTFGAAGSRGLLVDIDDRDALNDALDEGAEQQAAA